MCMAPRRIEDAEAVAERIRKAFDELAPMLSVNVGIARPSPAMRPRFSALLRATRLSGNRAASRGINFLRVVDEEYQRRSMNSR